MSRTLVVSLLLCFVAPALDAQDIIDQIPFAGTFDLTQAGSLTEQSPCHELPLPGREAVIQFTASEAGRLRIVARPIDATNILIVAQGDPLQAGLPDGPCLGSSDESGAGLPEVLVIDVEPGAVYELMVAESPLDGDEPLGEVEVRIDPVVDPLLRVARFDAADVGALDLAVSLMSSAWDVNWDELWAVGEVDVTVAATASSETIGVETFSPPYAPSDRTQAAARTTLRFDRFLYGVAEESLEISLRIPGAAVTGEHVAMVASEWGDVEQVIMTPDGDRWTGMVYFGPFLTPLDGFLTVRRGDLLLGVWQDPAGDGSPEHSAYALGLMEGRQSTGALLINVGADVVPVVPELEFPDGREPRALGAIADDNGAYVMLASKELVVNSDDGENNALENATGGLISDVGVLSSNDPFRVLEFEPLPVDLDTATVILELLGGRGELRVSDETTLSLLVLAAEARLRGISASPNWVMTPHGQPRTSHASNKPDMFQGVAPGTDALQGLQRAWMYSAIFEAEQPIPIAVIDSNFCPMLVPDVPVLGGFDFYNLSVNPFGRADNFGIGAKYHGTLMAGIIGAGFSNGIGADGIAGSMARLWLYNVGGLMFYKDAAAATFDAVDKGAQVINMSFGFPCGIGGISWCLDVNDPLDAFSAAFIGSLCPLLDPFLEIIRPFLPLPPQPGPAYCLEALGFMTASNTAIRAAIAFALLENRAVVASAGNTDIVPANTVEMFQIVPAIVPGVITVGVTNLSYRNTEFFGDRVDLWLIDSAPACTPDSDRDDCGGGPLLALVGRTSTGAAMASSIVAMMRNLNPSLSPARLRAILRSSTVRSPIAAPFTTGDVRVPRFLRSERALIRAGVLNGTFDPWNFAPSFGFDEEDSDGAVPERWQSGPGAFLTRPLRPAADAPATAIVIPRAEALGAGFLLENAAIHDFQSTGRTLEHDWYQIEADGDPCAAYDVTIDLDYPTAGGALSIDRDETPRRTVVGPLTNARWTLRGVSLAEPLVFEIVGDDNFYHLRVAMTRQASVAPDAFESNDVREDATLVSIATDPGFVTEEHNGFYEHVAILQELSTHCRGDVDWFRVVLPEIPGDEVCQDRIASCGAEVPGEDLSWVQVSTNDPGNRIALITEGGLTIASPRPGFIPCPRSNGFGTFLVRMSRSDTLSSSHTLRVEYRTPASESGIREHFEEIVEPYYCCENPAGQPCFVELGSYHPGQIRIDELNLGVTGPWIFEVPSCLDSDCLPLERLVFGIELPETALIDLAISFAFAPTSSFEGILFDRLGVEVGRIVPISDTEWRITTSSLISGTYFLEFRGLDDGSSFEISNLAPLSGPPGLIRPRILQGGGCAPAVIGIEVQAEELVAAMQFELRWDPTVADLVEARAVGGFSAATVFQREIEPGHVGLGLLDTNSNTRVDATTPVVALELRFTANSAANRTTAVCVLDVRGEAPDVLEPILTVGSGGDTRSLRAATGCVTAAFELDTVPPLISEIVETGREPHPDGAIVHLFATATDDCGVEILFFDPPSGSVFPFGSTLALCHARDLSGNTMTQVFEVVVEDPSVPFRRGDMNVDGVVNISDPQYLLSALFLGGPLPRCFDAADANDSNRIDISDAVAVLDYLFKGALPPPAPGPDRCGVDPTPSERDCDYPSALCGS